MFKFQTTKIDVKNNCEQKAIKTVHKYEFQEAQKKLKKQEWKS